MKVLLVGGAGYIGSHVAIVLLEAGHDVILYDNFVNSSRNIESKLKHLFDVGVSVVEGDVRDTPLLESTLEKFGIEAVIHLAGLKSVNDSLIRPIEYYDNNVQGAISLIKAMGNKKVCKLIFSSSATVYGSPVSLPIDEFHQLAPTTPYGRSKLFIENILQDLVKAESRWQVVVLRYFNPVGAHESGFFGENPCGIPNNLMPYITQVARGDLPYLKIFGSNYNTTDGTGVRDYIHVMDLADGHLAALNSIDKIEPYSIFNLGTGVGYSVFDVLKSFTKVSGQNIAYKVVDKRVGDVSVCYASVQLAKNRLNWAAKRSIDDMCQSSWVSAMMEKSIQK